MKLKSKARWLVAVIVTIAGIAPTAAGTSGPHVALTQINMSHDLVSLGIAAQNVTPNNPALDARPLIQAALNYVQTHPVQVLTLDTGAYYLLSVTQGNAVLFFPPLSNMTVDLAGSTVYFAGPFLPNGLTIHQCHNFTLKNFQLDFVNPPYTHVQITSVDANQRRITYAALPGWPNPATLNGLPVEGYWAAFFRNGAIVPGTTRTLLNGPFSGNTLDLTQDSTPWTQAPTLATLQPGDTVVVTARGGGAPLLVWEGDGITLSHISVYGSPTWAVGLQATSNSTVDGVRVVPRPGTGLVGSNADGIHFASVRQNNHIRNCYVTRTMDDALIMDSMYAATVVSQLGPRQLRVTRNVFLRFPNGTPVSFIDPLTTLETAGPTITAQSPPDSDSVAMNGQVDLTFDQDLPPLSAGMGMVYGLPAMRGQGSTIEDNLVEDLYGGRGIWIPGVEGVTVRRNVVRHTSMAGIAVLTDTSGGSGDAGPPAHDIVITDNSLEGALGPAANGTGEQAGLGAIEVAALYNQPHGFASASSHTNVTIANNYIADSGRSGLWIGELNGGTLQNNLVIRSNQNPTMGGIYGIPPQFQAQVAADALLPVVIRYSVGVSEIGDTINAASPIAAPVSFSAPSVSVPAAGGQASLNVATAVAGFAWKAIASDSWITITSADSGSGAGTLSYTVAPNPSGAARTGSITVAGRVFVVVSVPDATRVDLNGDGSGDAFVYKSTTGAWGRETSLAGGGFSGVNSGWAPGWTIEPAQFNNDALTDFFVFSATTGQWFKMLNDGAGGFTTQSTGGWWPGWQRKVMDLDGDGLSDLFLYDPVSGQWYKCLSTPTGFTYFAGGWGPGWALYPWNLNGDAREDLFLINPTTGQWVWAQSESGGSFTYPVWGAWGPGWQIYPGDFSGDGRSDLLLFNPTLGQYYVATNTGAGFSYVFGTWSPGWTPYVVDLDGNGRADLFLYHASGQWFQALSDGAGQFTFVGTGGWSPGWSLYPTDFNGDGRTDLLLYSPTTGVYFQAWNLTVGSFTYFSGGWDTGLTILVGKPVR